MHGSRGSNVAEMRVEGEGKGGERGVEGRFGGTMTTPDADSTKKGRNRQQ